MQTFIQRKSSKGYTEFFIVIYYRMFSKLLSVFVACLPNTFAFHRFVHFCKKVMLNVNMVAIFYLFVFIFICLVGTGGLLIGILIQRSNLVDIQLKKKFEHYINIFTVWYLLSLKWTGKLMIV